MQYLETDPGAKAKLKASNAIPVNGQISNGRPRDARQAMFALNLPTALSGVRANSTLHRFELRFQLSHGAGIRLKPAALVPRFSNLQ
jgi:hypothetical protein